MKKNVLVVLMFMVAFCAVVGQGLVSEKNNVWATDVGGPLTENTTFTLAESPYDVRFSIFVNDGVTLTIEPGVIMNFETGLSFIIGGKLVARGTKDLPIEFRANNLGDTWGQISFTETAESAKFDFDGNFTGGSIMEFCNIQNCKEDAIKGEESFPYFANCTIKNNSKLGISISGGGVTAILRNNDIFENKAGGIKISNINIVIMGDNNVLNNVGDGIHLSTFKELTMQNNNISDNTNNGVITSGFADSIIFKENVVSNNTFRGANLYDGGATFNEISNNKFNDSVENTALRVRGGGNITNNNFLRNKVAMRVKSEN